VPGYYYTMEIKEQILSILRENYEPVEKLEEADLRVTATSLFKRLEAVLPDLQTPSLVSECLVELGYKIADEGELEFVWILRQK